MIIPNAAVATYTYTIASIATKSGLVNDVGRSFTYSTPFKLVSTFGIGLGSRLIPFPNNLFPYFSVTIERQTWWNGSSQEYSWSVTLGGFGGLVYYSGRIPGWIDTIDCTVVINSGDFNVDGCYLPWTFTASSLQLYVEGALVYTSGSISDGADYYNPLVNCLLNDANNSGLYTNPTKPCCDPPIGLGYCDTPVPNKFCNTSGPFTPLTKSFHQTVTTTVSWTSTLGVPAIELYSFGGISPSDPDCTGSCDCSESLPTTSNATETNSEFEFNYSVVLEDTTEARFNSGNPIKWRWNGYRALFDVTYKRSRLNPVDKDESYNNTSRKEERALCNCSTRHDSGTWIPPTPTTTLVDGSDAVAYCAEFARVEKQTRNQLCWCADVPVGGTSTTPAPDNEDNECFFWDEHSLTWNQPSCEDDTTGSGPDITHDPLLPEYLFAFVQDSDIWFRRAPVDNPILGWANLVQVTNSGTNAEPAIFVAQNGIIWLLYTLSGTGVKYLRSPDGGNSWSSSSTLFTNGAYGRIVGDEHGNILITATKYVSGSSGPKKLYVLSIESGAVSLPSEVIAQNESGVEFQLEDECYGLACINGIFHLAAKKSGATSIAHWISDDFGITWTEIV